MEEADLDKLERFYDGLKMALKRAPWRARKRLRDGLEGEEDGP